VPAVEKTTEAAHAVQVLLEDPLHEHEQPVHKHEQPVHETQTT
jgi:hypothetical protein